MTNTRKQVLAEKFAAANKAAFKPRSDIEGLGRKLRAIMRKVDALGCAHFHGDNPRRQVWTGKWPGEEDCERLNFFVNGDPDFPENRLFTDCVWDATTCNGGSGNSSKVPQDIAAMSKERGIVAGGLLIYGSISAISRVCREV
jgi:hypothetical protein